MRRRATIQASLLAVITVLALVVGVQLVRTVPAAPEPSPTPTRIDWATVAAGSDASWPVCTPPHGTRRTLPLAESPSFVVVGVNDGLPGTVSACIERELAWARTATGGSSQPRLSYYVIAADPWTKPELRWVPHPAWPASNTVGTTTVRVPTAFAGAAHATCTGAHDDAVCAYVYGWAMAQHAAAIEGLVAPSRHRFWIDVESVRTWSDDQRFNQAVVEGMATAFTTPRGDGGVGTTTGVYSDRSEWTRIIGRLRKGSPLDGLDEWLAVGSVPKARAVEVLLQAWPMKPGGTIRVVQWLDGGIDRDIALPASAAH